MFSAADNVKATVVTKGMNISSCQSVATAILVFTSLSHWYRPNRSCKLPCNFTDRFMCTKYVINVQYWEDYLNVSELLHWWTINITLIYSSYAQS